MQPISTIAHRLRTPLTVITSTINNLLDGAFGPLNADQTKWLKKLPPHTTALEKILSDVLDILSSETEKSKLVGKKLEESATVTELSAQTRRSATPASAEVRGTGTILIVDDEPDIIDVLQEGLSSEGYRVIATTNGEDAFRYATTVRPDLILMDVFLSGQNGVDVCRRIKEALDVFTPVILVTGQGDLRPKTAATTYDADDLLMKPFQLQELFARVRSMLRMKKLTDELKTLSGKVKTEEEGV